MPESAVEVAVVTGGGSGIGYATAHRLARDGRAIAVWDIDETAARRCVEHLASEGVRAAPYVVDVSSYADVEAATAQTADELGPPRVLVTSAGARLGVPLLEMDPADWRRLLSVNLDGVCFCITCVGRVMAASGGGSIVNIASTAALNGFPQRAAYCASKAGVAGLTRAAALDLAPLNIRVNAVAPGSTLTAMTKPLEHDPVIREIVDTSPLRRWGQPEEIAEAIAFLAGPAASFITGVVLPVDGGWMAARTPIRVPSPA
jgi:NAD(P)-dependent dehydrogenase (short-subunit alcohol dehydrogenase family)